VLSAGETLSGDHVTVVRTPGELTAPWLAGVLGSGEISELTLTPIGTGQMSQSYRVAITYAQTRGSAPASVVVKLASEDPTSRATGQGLGAYMREVQFYRQLAPRIGGPTAICHASLIDAEGWFTIVLEDVADAAAGDQIGGCDIDHARLAMVGLAELHAAVYGDAILDAADWLNVPSPLNQSLLTQLFPAFLERYGERIAPEHVALCERFLPSVDGWAADARPPLGLVHGDYRLDNMLFAASGEPRPLTVVDWQTLSWGPMMLDASYFLAGSLTVETRRAHERELLGAYHAEMLERGAGDLDWEACWEGYRQQSFHGVLMAIAASMLVVRTERGDEMFTTGLARHAQQAIDLDAVELLPAPGAGRPAPLAPSVADEGRHEPTAEPLWNESYYFDAVSADGTLGAYVRIGLYPNLGVAWYTTFVCGPGRATVAVVDLQAPLPGAGALAVGREGLAADHLCEEPLQRFRVTLRAQGEAHRDASAFLRAEPGTPAEVSLDLVWETAGIPYSYRLTTRYEIPCTVSGTIVIDGEELQLAGPGQRDHSWGTRDWWSMDWMWSAGALDDGCRFHAVEVRIPNAPALGVGYLQPGDGELIELDGIDATEEIAADGLIVRARIAVGAGLAPLAVEPLAFGPLRLVAPDGRVTHFPRAMCRFRTEDGRRGLGWVEWNRNQRA
jgi:hypothetical protein